MIRAPAIIRVNTVYNIIHYWAQFTVWLSPITWLKLLTIAEWIQCLNKTFTGHSSNFPTALTQTFLLQQRSPAPNSRSNARSCPQQETLVRALVIWSVELFSSVLVDWNVKIMHAHVKYYTSTPGHTQMGSAPLAKIFAKNRPAF